MNAVVTPPPAAPPAPRPVTPDDLLRMGGDGKRYELAGGRLEERDVSFLSCYVAGKAYKALDRHTEATGAGWVLPEGTSFQCFPDDRAKVRRADAAFFALDRITFEQATAAGHFPLAPDIVVEVNSPNDLASAVILKVNEWLRAGARLVWVFDPEAKQVESHDRDNPGVVTIYREGDTLTGGPVLPGFAVPVAELFRLPVSPAPAP